MSSNVAIIFGAGAKVGTAVAKKFLENSYKVVTVSRSDLSLDGFSKNAHFHYKGDLADVSVVTSVFSKTKELFGEPRIVIYNAAALASGFTKTSDAFLKITPETFAEDIAVNLTAPFFAIQESTKSFKNVKSDKPKAFLYTGNMQNIQPFPFIPTLGIGKSGTFSAIGVADKFFKEDGYRFIYADERNADGSAMIQGTTGEGHADFYFELAEHDHEEIPVDATFVTGKGYTKF